MSEQVNSNVVAARCSYSAPLSDFMKTSEATWIIEMMNHAPGASPEQVAAWKDCFDVLKHELVPITEQYPSLNIVFEYILPYEAGRRPDVLLVGAEIVVVLEFKMKQTAKRADVDQVAAYARDLREYHFESREREVVPLLVLTKASDPDLYLKDGSVYICSGRNLASVLAELIPTSITSTDINQWMESKYEPLPTIVEAARMIMKKEPLPAIRTVNSTTIPDALECLENLVRYAQQNKKHMLAMVTGVPGAGKTYLGLQFVYNVCESNEMVNSVYLSGNGPLVRVLSSALKSKVFVKDLHRQLEEYTRRRALDFNKNVVVFDEGQRAWNIGQMSDRRGVDASEPDLMVQMMERRLMWSVLLVLVGEGQEIYTGEEADLTQWSTALEKAQLHWEVVCPEKLASVFPNVRVHCRDQLDLSVSLRTHLAQDVSTFANELITGELLAAKDHLEAAKQVGFTAIVTRDLEQEKVYCRERYEEQLSKRYGLIVSSKAETRMMKRYGIDNSYLATSLKTMDIGSWYNDAPNSEHSCCALKKVVTEFSCQGLELDMPILCWGFDMIWNGSSWRLFDPSVSSDDLINVYRRNSYRVLLTRGRDGLVVFVPPEGSLDATYKMLLEVGFEQM